MRAGRYLWLDRTIAALWMRARCPGGVAAQGDDPDGGAGVVAYILANSIGSAAAAAFPQMGNGHSMTGSPGNLGGVLNVGHHCGVFDKAGPESDVFDCKFLRSEARDVELPIAPRAWPP
jgi:hypothetical protein